MTAKLQPLPHACAFHAYDGLSGPCPWCAEAAGLDSSAPVWDNSSSPHCPRCESPDRLLNEIGGYFWCGACGWHYAPEPA